MIEQLKTIREALQIEATACQYEHFPVSDHIAEALIALDQLEVLARGCEALTVYAAPPTQQSQYEAGDVASASAQGFRDGVASVQEVRLVEVHPDGTETWTGERPVKMPIPPGMADPLDVMYAEGWNAACDAFFSGKPVSEPVVITVERG